MQFNLLALSTLVASAFGASLSAGTAAIEVSDRRVTTIGGHFADNQIVTANDVGTGGIIVASSDGELLSDIKTAWANAAGSASGIYYELQEVDFLIYPGQSKELPASATLAIYLPPLNKP